MDDITGGGNYFFGVVGATEKPLRNTENSAILHRCMIYPSEQHRAKMVRDFFRFFAISPIPKRLEEFLGSSLSDAINHAPTPKKNNTLEYLKKGEKWASFLRFCPFVRGVAIVNTVSFGVAKPLSDIDVLVVTAPHKMWTARFFVTLFLALCGVRRSKIRIAGQMCLSFFVDETVADFSALKLPFDPYLAFWCAGMIPVFGTSFFSAFYTQNTPWVLNEIAVPILFHPSKIPSGKNTFQSVLEIFFCFIESPIRYFWKKRTLHKKSLLKDQSGTIVSEHILKFHDEDKREEWAKRMA
ncbi:MAG: hypothetical protein WCJ84_00990 [Candidatus Peregrinibacteria bacterium]